MHMLRMLIMRPTIFFGIACALCRPSVSSLAVQGSSGELREIAAEGLGELVEVTSQEALRPFTVQITGTQYSAPTSRS